MTTWCGKMLTLFFWHRGCEIMRRVKALVFLVLMGISVLLFVGDPNAADDTATAVKDHAVDDAPVQAASGRVPLLFVPNVGQMDARVYYSGRGQGYGVYFTPEEVMFAFVQQSPQSHRREASTAMQTRTVA